MKARPQQIKRRICVTSLICKWVIKLSLICSLFEYFYASLSRWIRVLRFILPFWSLGCILIAVLTFSFNTWSTVQMYIFKPYENSYILNSNAWPNNALIHFWSIELKSICSIIQFNWIPKHYLGNADIFSHCANKSE